MTKTANEVCTRALRDLGAVGNADSPEAEELAYAGQALDALLTELSDVHGAVFTWTRDTVPDQIFLPMAQAVGSLVSGTYSVNGPSYSRAIGKIRAYLMPDDREDRADIDDSGTVSSEEADADLRAQYY